MNNNDIIIRLRYALHLDNPTLLSIFKAGGLQLNAKDLDRILTRQADDTDRQANLSNHDLEAFLNGLIVHYRGHQKDAQGHVRPGTFDIHGAADVNNVAIKKIKIALAYTSKDLQKQLAKAGEQVSNGEISAILRRKDHRNYRPAGDRYLRKLLQGMSMD
ncbi:DUF1456 family protein [Lactobacillaceae bacterium L1_55_11]|nr:DUF1456 family protein [Lactobacillaceae bacterium L1_55_11]